MCSIFLQHFCHFDEGEIFARNSTKIGEFLDGATREDFSFVEVTNSTLQYTFSLFQLML